MSDIQVIEIAVGSAKVSAILEIPTKPFAGLTLAHGAGAGMRHPFLEKLAAGLIAEGVAVLRFQFPYMEEGRRRTDSPKIATEAVASAVHVLQKQLSLPLFISGKSFGARMSTTALSEGLLSGIKGAVCFGFPLHSAGEPSVKRAEHLARVEVPLLFLQGTRDELADLALMRKVCAKLTKAKLHVVEGADHSFSVLKRSGRTNDDVMSELVRETSLFLRKP